MTIRTRITDPTQSVALTTVDSSDGIALKPADSSKVVHISRTANTEPPSREATASIRGYLYQFDATIKAILSLKDDQALTVEDIEDFDIVVGSSRRGYHSSSQVGTKLLSVVCS
jgi:hypothetical protein